MKLKKSNCDETQKLKIQIVTELKNSNCDKTQIVTKLKLGQNSNCDKPQIVTKVRKNQVMKRGVKNILTS